jgi:ethanolamine-phosphate cytidylyltransferase
MDGVFDLMHYGHSNALRQARSVGDVLIVGLVNDAEVIKNKGTPPVTPEQERYTALSACKWVDEVIRDAPYDLTEAWVTTLVEKYAIDYIVHGDDPCITADGKDAYAYAKRIGKYKQIKRTEGVSTTDIVGRMLLMSCEHHLPGPTEEERAREEAGLTSGSVRERTGSLRSSSLSSLKDLADEAEGVTDEGERSASPPLPSVHSKFLPTARRIMQFADGRVPKPEDRVVYMAGSFDLFCSGHIDALKKAREYGDFLLVGIHDDATVHRNRSHGLPILNLYERALSLLSCKYVDEVIIGAPWVITEEMIRTMNITTVVDGTVSDMTNKAAHEQLGWSMNDSKVSHLIDQSVAIPRAMNILKVFESPSPLTALDIVGRIFTQRDMFQGRYDRKSKMEDAYVKNKSYVQET